MTHPSIVPDLRAKELLTLVALARYGSFVAAAAHLKTSQPALTRTVKRVERLLGVTLFARNTRRVEITPAGREFVAMAERVIADLQLAVRSMADLSGEQRGRVTISTYSAWAVYVVPDIVERFRRTRPSVEIRIKEGHQLEILEDIRSGVADFGIGIVDRLPDTMRSEVLRNEPLFVVVPPGHPFLARKRARLRIADLQGEPLISAPADSHLRRLIDGAAAAEGVTLQYPVIVDRLLSMLVHVLSGSGIAVMPEGALPPRPWRDFEGILLDESRLTISVGLISLAGRYQTPASAGLMAVTREVAEGWKN